MTDITEIIKAIQYVLAPAVMVSSAALLLLGYQNKSSNLASRFRLLNHEKRLLTENPKKTASEEKRFQSVNIQISFLMKRAVLIRNAILVTYFAILSFAATSIFIFIDLYFDRDLYAWIIGIFLSGLAGILAGCIFMIFETRFFYQVISLEDRQ